MRRQRNVAVIIPCYKAASTIRAVVERIPEIVKHIIIVNDGSPDEMDAEISMISDPRIVYIKHEKNQGVGAAMVTGYKEALKLDVDFTAKIDADGQMNPGYLGSFVQAAINFNCDYIKGNRFGHIDELQSMPKVRLAGNIILSFLTKIASGYWNLFDPQNGYVMIKRSMLRKLNLDKIDKSYFFENSMLINLNILRAKVAEIYFPAKYGNEESSMHLTRILFSFPAKLLRGLCYRIYQKYIFRGVSPVFLFLVAGIPALLFGVIFGAMAWYNSHLSGTATPTGTIVISLLHILLGAMLVLQSIVLIMFQLHLDKN